MDAINGLQGTQEQPRGQKRARDESSDPEQRNKRSRGGRGGRDKRADMGRTEWSRNAIDKRAKIEKSRAGATGKSGGEVQKLPVYATQFSKEELEAETKKPKRKVAVMIGYAGTGYKGLQLSHREKTIEGDLFKAFVDAGAIGKANADDPKKVSLVRCARTDKGVHAAGNLLSLKLIVEDGDIVEKINKHLTPQIRVFGIERTNGSFSAYQFCDSRIYEYLIPTHCFLSPHKNSYLGRKLEQLADEANDIEAYRERQKEVLSYWDEIEEKHILPILEQLDPSIRSLVQKALYEMNLKEAEGEFNTMLADKDIMKSTPKDDPSNTVDSEEQEGVLAATNGAIDAVDLKEQADISISAREALEAEKLVDGASLDQEMEDLYPLESENAPSETNTKEPSALETAVRQLRAAYIDAKKTYRIDPRRLDRVRSVLSRFNGTHNFHNYTIDKAPRDPSAKRVIKSFIVAADPMIINDTEWLSLKVHGQSFMMHQIRKMISMLALVVRCGSHEGRIQDSYLSQRLSIPKAPSLGLLLERPVFDAYNEKLVGFGREPIDFKRVEKEMSEFKQREIYERIFREEDRSDQFHSFFAALDNLKNSRLLYLSSVGLKAVKTDDVPATKSENVGMTAIEEASSDDVASGAEEG